MWLACKLCWGRSRRVSPGRAATLRGLGGVATDCGAGRAAAGAYRRSRSLGVAAGRGRAAVAPGARSRRGSTGCSTAAGRPAPPADQDDRAGRVVHQRPVAGPPVDRALPDVRGERPDGVAQFGDRVGDVGGDRRRGHLGLERPRRLPSPVGCAGSRRRRGRSPRRSSRCASPQPSSPSVSRRTSASRSPRLAPGRSVRPTVPTRSSPKGRDARTRRRPRPDATRSRRARYIAMVPPRTHCRFLPPAQRRDQSHRTGRPPGEDHCVGRRTGQQRVGQQAQHRVIGVAQVTSLCWCSELGRQSSTPTAALADRARPRAWPADPPPRNIRTRPWLPPDRADPGRPAADPVVRDEHRPRRRRDAAADHRCHAELGRWSGSPDSRLSG